MKIIKKLLLSLAMAASAFAAQAATYTATFVPTSSTSYILLGFGRATESFAGSFAASAALPPGREFFFDTYNVDTSAMAPGNYNFPPVTVNAEGSVEFSAMILNWYDTGARKVHQFAIAPDFKSATGSGTFKVEASCGVTVCVWIDVFGTQDIGDGAANYAGEVAAALVPEPETYALMLFGLGAIGFIARRRARAAA